jgi:hypothetical protein
VAASGEDLAGKWTGFADTIDVSGVRRRMQQTIEIKGAGKDLRAGQMSSKGAGIPLKLVSRTEGRPPRGHDLERA